MEPFTNQELLEAVLNFRKLVCQLQTEMSDSKNIDPHNAHFYPPTFCSS